jgi:predicted DNA-binding transcriptional regulator AlpA
MDIVIACFGIGKTMFYRKTLEGTFPRCCKPGSAFLRQRKRDVRERRDEVMAARSTA